MLLLSEYYKIPDLLGDAGSTPYRVFYCFRSNEWIVLYI